MVSTRGPAHLSMAALRGAKTQSSGPRLTDPRLIPLRNLRQPSEGSLSAVAAHVGRDDHGPLGHEVSASGERMGRVLPPNALLRVDSEEPGSRATEITVHCMRDMGNRTLSCRFGMSLASAVMSLVGMRPRSADCGARE